jgi:hypothetical protein
MLGRDGEEVNHWVLNFLRKLENDLKSLGNILNLLSHLLELS